MLKILSLYKWLRVSSPTSHFLYTYWSKPLGHVHFKSSRIDSSNLVIISYTLKILFPCCIFIVDF